MKLNAISIDLSQHASLHEYFCTILACFICSCAQDLSRNAFQPKLFHNVTGCDTVLFKLLH